MDKEDLYVVKVCQKPPARRELRRRISDITRKWMSHQRILGVNLSRIGRKLPDKK
jgi:hypothetical protein